VSFGLFGDQGVFRSEATGAAQVVAARFVTGPIDAEYNSRKGGNATIEALTRSLQAAANGLVSKKDVLFLILTSHGSPDGLAIKAGWLTQTLTPSRLGDMLVKTGVRHKVVVISACYSGVLYGVWRLPICWSSPRPMPTIRHSAVRTRPSGPISATLFSTSRSGKPST